MAYYVKIFKNCPLKRFYKNLTLLPENWHTTLKTQKSLLLLCQYHGSSSASVSSRSISDSQSSAHMEHSPVVPHSSQSDAPHMSQDKSWSSGISFLQFTHLTISCSRLWAVSDYVFFEFAFFCHLVVPAFPAESIV